MSLQLAEQFEANEQYEEAFREYKKEYEHNLDDLGLLERLGHLSLILEKPEEAAYYYHEILKRDLKNPLAYEQLMSIYENTDKYKYYIYRGNKNSLEGKLDFAINDFKKALSVSDEETQIIMTRLTLANLYRQTGNNLKAIDEAYACGVITSAKRDKLYEKFANIESLNNYQSSTGQLIRILERDIKSIQIELNL